MPRDTLLPWRSFHRVNTADLPADALDSTIPPLPPRLPPDVDPGDPDDPDRPAPGDGAGCFLWPVISAGAVLLCALLAHWAAYWAAQ